METNKQTAYTRSDLRAVVRKMRRAGRQVSSRPVVKLGKAVAWIITWK